MKGIDLFCSSPASTAICSSMVDHSMVRRCRKNPLPHVPCSSHLPINPRPYYEKSRKSYSKQSHEPNRKSAADDIHDINSSTAPDHDASRHLLSDSHFVDWFSKADDHDHDHVPALVPAVKYRSPSSNNSPRPALKSSASTRSCHQVINNSISSCSGKVHYFPRRESKFLSLTP